MVDERAKYFKRLRRLRRSARKWSVYAGTFGGAAAILVPYRGLGWPDAIWAALTGGSAAMAFWRWSDFRELAAQPAPESLDPARAASLTQARIEALIGRLPAGRGALAELRRMQSKAKVRGSSVVPAWTRLDRAAQTLAGLAGRLGGPAESVVLEASVAERTLRDLGERTASVERGLRLTPGDLELEQAHAALLEHFTEGVEAYERLVGAAAGYVAQDGRLTADDPSIGRLREATDLLRGIADGLSELRTMSRLTRPRPANSTVVGGVDRWSYVGGLLADGGVDRLSYVGGLLADGGVDRLSYVGGLLADGGVDRLGFPGWRCSSRSTWRSSSPTRSRRTSAPPASTSGRRPAR
jgi:hypothetical protein